MTGSPQLTVAALRDAFDVVPGYLDAATMGLPPRASVDALREALAQWAAGAASAAGYDAVVQAGRHAFGRLMGVPTSWVAVGSQVSAMLAPVGAGVPAGAEVLVPEHDFASLMFPFLVHRDRGVRVRTVPLDALATSVTGATAVVACSLAQSADGRLVDLPAVLAAARARGALTVCDTTHAAGWLPVPAGQIDVTVCAAYKWLACPRGVAFATVSPAAAERLRPVAAGWYAGESPWDSIYGPQMVLAADARRFDVSPVWLAWVGAEPALELFSATDPAALRAHGAGLAAQVRAGLGLPETGSPVVSLPDPDGALASRLRSAGCAFAARAGGLRLAFHVWNDAEDVARVLEAC